MNKFTTSYRKLNSKDILCEPSYQRPLDFSRVKKIAANFNPNLVNPIKVSQRNGKYYVFDGQHTLRVLEMMNGGKPVVVDCKVYLGLSIYDEARLFAGQTGISRPITATQKLKSLFIAKDIDVLDFKKAVEAAGVKCTFGGGGSDALKCYSTAWKVFSRYGAEQLTDVLDIIVSAWHFEDYSLSKEIILGVHKFTQVYRDEFDRAALIKRLSKVSPIEIVRRGKTMLSGGEKRFAYCILEQYNVGTSKGRLENRLI